MQLFVRLLFYISAFVRWCSFSPFWLKCCVVFTQLNGDCKKESFTRWHTWTNGYLLYLPRLAVGLYWQLYLQEPHNGLLDMLSIVLIRSNQCWLNFIIMRVFNSNNNKYATLQYTFRCLMLPFLLYYLHCCLENVLWSKCILKESLKKRDCTF